MSREQTAEVEEVRAAMTRRSSESNDERRVPCMREVVA
jgi:hypothetical protein